MKFIKYLHGGQFAVVEDQVKEVVDVEEGKKVWETFTKTWVIDTIDLPEELEYERPLA